MDIRFGRMARLSDEISRKAYLWHLLIYLSRMQIYNIFSW